MKQKVLIISYYWPPAGGPGVQRWLKFVKYLPDFNYQPVVYIPSNPTYAMVDNHMEQDLGKDVTIIKNKISEPYKLAKLFWPTQSSTLSAGMIPSIRKQTKTDKFLLAIRGNFFIPDARIGWVDTSVEFLKEYLSKNTDVTKVITTGPPHSMHLIGLALKQELNIKWVADFRDPWTTIGYHKDLKLMWYAKYKHIKMERKVLENADHILVTSQGTKREFSQKTKRPITVITNGYDTIHTGKVELDKKFTLAHVGSFLSDRNPRVLWKALAELCKENPSFKENFELKLIGKVSQDIFDTIKEFGLDTSMSYMGYLSHLQAYKQMKASQVLLLVEIDSENTKCIIPGKIFEYMASERPILAIGPEESDFFDIILSTNTGKVSLYSEKDQIKEILLDYFEKYQNNQLYSHAMGLQYYSRKKLTQALSTVLNKL
ncbi:glycosyltransferase family 4 protein [Myroides sp. LJL115]